MAGDGREFEGMRRRVSISDGVWDIWQAHRQYKANQPESFGVLIGSTLPDRRVIYVEDVTTPMRGDRQSRYSFDLQDPGHQKAVNAAHQDTGGSQIYLGTWHTHPERNPSPSGTDKADWRCCLRRNDNRPLIFVIAGTESIRVFVPWGRWFRALKELTEKNQ